MTDWKALARPSLRDLTPYHPGLTRDELKEQLGLDHLEPLNWNEDLFGPPQEALDAAAAELRNAAFYPERAYADFQAAAAEAVDWADRLLGDATGLEAFALLAVADPATAARVAYLLEWLVGRTP